MAVLTAILTHLEAPVVERQMAYLRALCPGSSFVVCHGGRRSDYAALSDGSALFIEDPSLRGPHFEKSVNETLFTLYESRVRDDDAIEHVYLIEYDQVILRPDFEERLTELMQRTGAGMLAKWATPRNDSNWPPFLAGRRDDELNRFVASISRREDPERRIGCLGTGILFRRDALEAFCALESPPSRYVEMFVPTVVHHLGFDVVDVDSVADLYMGIRWLPEFGVDEARAQKRAGRVFVHPFKQLDALDSLAAA